MSRRAPLPSLQAQVLGGGWSTLPGICTLNPALMSRRVKTWPTGVL
jgi:hypothetical protein